MLKRLVLAAPSLPGAEAASAAMAKRGAAQVPLIDVLFFGNEGMRRAVSQGSRDYLRKFWSPLDNILNSVLFLLIGLEVLVVARSGLGFWWAGLAAIPVALGGRWLSVAVAG